MHCPLCNRKPSEIGEYVDQARELEISAEDYVRMDEGTYHKLTDMFLCTDCYIQQGMPLKHQLFNLFWLLEGNVVPLVRK